MPKGDTMANPAPLDQDPHHLKSYLRNLQIEVSQLKSYADMIDAVMQDPDTDCPPDIKVKLKLSKDQNIQMAIVQGNAQHVMELLDAGYSTENVMAFAAFCGHEIIVKELIKRGEEPDAAVFFCIMGGHLPILVDLIEHGIDEDHAIFFAVSYFYAHPHVLLGLLEARPDFRVGIERHIRHVGFFETPRSTADFLKKITNPITRVQFAELADGHDPDNHEIVRLVPLTPIVSGMIRYKLNYEEALAWRENARVLPVLLLQEQGACGLPNDVWEKIASHLNPPTSSPLSVPQMHRVKIAIRQAYEPAWFNRLESLLRRRPFGEAKANQLHDATTMTQRINALYEQRWKHRVRTSFLPKSLRQTMVRFPEYCNGLTLQRWLENCAAYLECCALPKQRHLGMQLRSLISLMSFPGENDDPKLLAALLENDHGQPKSVRDLLEGHPCWKNLMELFPTVSARMSPRDRGEPRKMIGFGC